LQLFPRDQLAGALGQQRQHLTRLILQLDALTCFVNFRSSQIQFELIKATEVRGMGQVCQGRLPLREA
jgi:hypothetical protein